MVVHYSPMKSRKRLAWDVFNYYYYNPFATHAGLVYVMLLIHTAWHKMAALTVTVTHKIKTSPVCVTFKY